MLQVGMLTVNCQGVGPYVCPDASDYNCGCVVNAFCDGIPTACGIGDCDCIIRNLCVENCSGDCTPTGECGPVDGGFLQVFCLP
jgi:hypothetical protein